MICMVWCFISLSLFLLFLPWGEESEALFWFIVMKGYTGDEGLGYIRPCQCGNVNENVSVCCHVLCSVLWFVCTPFFLGRGRPLCLDYSTWG